MSSAKGDSADAGSAALQVALWSLNAMVATAYQDISGVSGNGFPLRHLQGGMAIRSRAGYPCQSDERKSKWTPAPLPTEQSW